MGAKFDGKLGDNFVVHGINTEDGSELICRRKQ